MRKVVVRAQSIAWWPNPATAPSDAGPGIALQRGAVISEEELTTMTTEDVVATWWAQKAIRYVEE